MFQVVKNNPLWRFISQRLQLKMILVSTLALLIPITVIGIYSMQVTTDQVLRTAQGKDLEFVKSQSAAALRFLTEGERDTLYLSQSPATRRYVGTLVGTDDSSTQILLASQLKLFLKDTPNYLSVQILDISGQEVFGIDNRDGNLRVTPTDQLENQAGQLSFIEPLRLAGPVYISDVALEMDGKQIIKPFVPIIRFSLPLYAESGGIAGVIVIKALAEPLITALSVNTDDEALYIIDQDSNYLSNPNPDKLFGKLLKTGVTFAQDQPNDSAAIQASTEGEGTIFRAQDRPEALQSFVTVNLPGRDDANWTFIFEEKQSKVLSDVNNARMVIIGLAGLALLVGFGLVLLITRNIVLPVQQLARISAAISRGKWDVTVPSVQSSDEIGKLAVAFDLMSKELRTLYGDLEMRVLARTSELETVAKVGAATAAILDLDQLLHTTSELTRASFELSKVQVYLLDATTQTLTLAAISDASNDPARRTSIALAATDSLVALAGRDRRGVKIDQPAELALPLMVANRLLGMIDLHSEQPGRFTDLELRVMTILADQIAVAVQNAFFYKEQLATAHQLAIARQRAEEANKAKSLFLSNMSHELRTPLNIVIGYTSSMLERPSMYENIALPPIYARDIKLIRENGRHLIGLINDILDLSKIEAGRLELVREPIILTDIFRGVLATSVGLVKDKPVLIKSDIPDLLPPVYVDPTRVRQIILNLMSNAVKFTEQGSVTLRASIESNFVKIAVIDTGIGIPEKSLPHIFDRFQQVSHDTSRIYGGTGLGLDISKQLCQMHGGDLTVESVYGQGSTFTFALPVMDGQYEQIGQIPGLQSTVDGAPKTAQVFATSGSPEKAAARTVMLVEDDISSTDFIGHILESAGFFVLSTNDDSEAVEMALAVMPDLILLDIQHSMVTGWDILNRLRGEDEIAPIPIIVCSADGEKQALDRSDAVGFIAKPFTSQTILEEVERVIGLAHSL
ncbi:MAG: response regulator [Chloroflexi bacterium]|nr:response regulator [Chloroflexota bacterium]